MRVSQAMTRDAYIVSKSDDIDRDDKWQDVDRNARGHEDPKEF
jgi:hypothetical protein